MPAYVDRNSVRWSIVENDDERTWSAKSPARGSAKRYAGNDRMLRGGGTSFEAVRAIDAFAAKRRDDTGEFREPDVIAGPDPWDNDRGTFTPVRAAVARTAKGLIDIVVDVIRAAPELLKKLVELIGVTIDLVLAPIRAVKKLLANIELGLLAIAAGVLLYMFHTSERE